MTMTKFSRINKQREEITMRVLEDIEGAVVNEAAATERPRDLVAL